MASVIIPEKGGTLTPTASVPPPPSPPCSTLLHAFCRQRAPRLRHTRKTTHSSSPRMTAASNFTPRPVSRHGSARYSFRQRQHATTCPSAIWSIRIAYLQCGHSVLNNFVAMALLYHLASPAAAKKGPQMAPQDLLHLTRTELLALERELARQLAAVKARLQACRQCHECAAQTEPPPCAPPPQARAMN